MNRLQVWRGGEDFFQVDGDEILNFGCRKAKRLRLHFDDWRVEFGKDINTGLLKSETADQQCGTSNNHNKEAVFETEPDNRLQHAKHLAQAG